MSSSITNTSVENNGNTNVSSPSNRKKRKKNTTGHKLLSTDTSSTILEKPNENGQSKELTSTVTNPEIVKVDYGVDNSSKDTKETKLEERDEQSHLQKRKQEEIQSDHLEVQHAIQLSRLPLISVATDWKLAPFLQQNLQRDEYTHFFPIQTWVIPQILASERYQHIRSRDICVSSPTGSGKTLAFVLPILHCLHSRIVRRLRALIVLPSRDLAIQVFHVFQRYSEGSDLTIGLATGQSDFEVEQQALILGSSTMGDNKYKSLWVDDPEAALLNYSFHPKSARNALLAFGAFDSTQLQGMHSTLFHQSSHKTKTRMKNHYLNHHSLSSCPSNIQGLLPSLGRGGRSAVDILVCTPGRLIDHLDKTPGFTLQHVRFLVIDEADRLLNQSYQNWIGRVMEAATYKPSRTREEPTGVHHTHPYTNIDSLLPLDPITWRHDVLAEYEIADSYIASSCHHVQLRKLLFSATMTNDLQKLSSLGLIHPKYFNAHHLTVESLTTSTGTSTTTPIDSSSLRSTIPTNQKRADEQYSLPSGLTEFTVECTSQQKPLVLLSILLEQKILDGHSPIAGTTSTGTTTMNHPHFPTNGIVVVFTSSLDSTHRLARLLQILWFAGGYGPPTAIAEFSSSFNAQERAKLLRRCGVMAHSPNTNNDMNSNLDHEDTDIHSSSETDAKIEVLVCSDGISRGMDLPHVTAVIHYDVPKFAKTYIHRCGRTARAGRQGRAICVLKKGQVGSFLKMRRCIDDFEKVTTLEVRKDLIKGAVSVYKSCLLTLSHVIDQEERGEIGMTAQLSKEHVVSVMKK